jgi:hypothetical protein
LLVTGLQADNEVYRTWTDAQGRKLEATFRGIENGQVFLQVRNGYVYRLPLDKLSAEDQQAAKTLKPEGLGIPGRSESRPGRRAHRHARGWRLEARRQQKPNPLASDEQFVRRVLSRHRRAHPHARGSARVHQRHQSLQARQGHRQAC